MRETHLGVMAMIAACVVWGLSGIYYKALSHVPPEQVLSHRVLWSFLFFAGVLLVQGRIRALRAAFADGRSALLLAFATAMISLNWFVFISSVQTGHATEASLGYYIFPLLSVLLGRLVFGERLARAQLLAVLLAGAAVAVLSFGLGAAPLIPLVLSVSFALYGVAKKRLSLGPVVSVTAEVLLILPVALTVIWLTGGAGFLGSPADAAMLAFSGILTGLPLILFSYAAKRVRLGTVGVLQYLNPTLQFLVAVLLFAEPFTPWHGAAFALIWSAVAVFSFSALRQERASRRAAMAATGVSAQIR
ncbi:EamA family transporter RarD [Leisingera caerulea]|uniref:EamA family transporter RarD n=1 Tax=Leisingera caerulea TaxID=506591 RepID=UPI0021A63D55|nr:EamA family transporter RarD [Leisingera caerulea]UWQ51260.1 EamA family transporter RarD [Leisingera caerulea]UWQ85053.1 EamA family transporter RarD [Leisingera caerulea]